MIEISGVRTPTATSWPPSAGGGRRGLISLTVRPGEIVAVCGGDSAELLELVAGDRRPSEGSVRVNGRDPYTERSAVTVAALSAADSLYGDLTVNEISGAWRTWAAHPLNPAADSALATLPRRGPIPYTRLTPAERRRFDLAMALTGLPDALVLTEPTTRLSAADSRPFWRVLRSLPVPVLIATTSPQEARKADRTLLLTAFSTPYAA
ncbi:hypothetical protein GCM10027589_26420 [Actinocorallia lasiicapitis]